MTDEKKSIGDIPGSNTLLCGGIGTGKTHSIRTLIDAGITPFIIFTEPGMRTLSDVPSDKLHWVHIKTATVGFEGLLANAKKINSMSYEGLTKLGSMDKAKYQQLMMVLGAAHNFVCDRTGESFGSADTWGTDRALVIDGLSGMSKMAMDLVIGAKPVKHQGEWGVAMDNLERILDMFSDNLWCHYVLIAHLEREKDEVTGAIRNMPSTLGNKLAPKVNRNFDDVVMCKEAGGKYTWNTTDSQTDLKNRNLEKGIDLPPSFVPLIDSWVKAGGVISSENPEVK